MQMGIKLKHSIFLLSVLSGVQPKLNVNYVWGINFEFTELRSMSKRRNVALKLGLFPEVQYIFWETE